MSRRKSKAIKTVKISNTSPTPIRSKKKSEGGCMHKDQNNDENIIRTKSKSRMSAFGEKSILVNRMSI